MSLQHEKSNDEYGKWDALLKYITRVISMQ